MMRLTINRRMDAKTMFARWRVNAPYKPITRKGLGQRMGGGKGAIDHYVTPVKYGRIIVEFGGRCSFEEVEPFLSEVAKKLPFPAKAVSKKALEDMLKEDEQKARDNQNPWTFARIATMNMMGIRKVLSPFDLKYHDGRVIRLLPKQLCRKCSRKRKWTFAPQALMPGPERPQPKGPKQG
eukprot:g43618.t1